MLYFGSTHNIGRGNHDCTRKTANEFVSEPLHVGTLTIPKQVGREPNKCGREPNKGKRPPTPPPLLRLLDYEIDGGHRRRNRTWIRHVEGSYVVYGRNVMSTSLLEVSLLRVGTVLRLERDAWSMVKRLRQATNEYAPLYRSMGRSWYAMYELKDQSISSCFV